MESGRPAAATAPRQRHGRGGRIPFQRVDPTERERRDVVGELVDRRRRQVELRIHAGDGGVQECGYAQNCVEVCPKDIPLTRSIAEVGGDVMKQAIGDLFSK